MLFESAGETGSCFRAGSFMKRVAAAKATPTFSHFTSISCQHRLFLLHRSLATKHTRSYLLQFDANADSLSRPSDCELSRLLQHPAQTIQCTYTLPNLAHYSKMGVDLVGLITHAWSDVCRTLETPLLSPSAPHLPVLKISIQEW